MYITHLLITKSSVKRATFFAPVIVIHIEKNLDIKEALYKICFIEFPLHWCNLLRMDLYVSYSLFVRLSLRASDDENLFAILKWEGNWGELTFAKTSGIVTADAGKTELDHSWPVRSREQLGAHFGCRTLLVSKVANAPFTYVLYPTPPYHHPSIMEHCYCFVLAGCPVLVLKQDDSLYIRQLSPSADIPSWFFRKSVSLKIPESLSSERSKLWRSIQGLDILYCQYHNVSYSQLRNHVVV